ncbi:MFS transporter, partial [Klebsiella pneumoniae]
MRRVFRSLASFNYRVWAAGALVSNIGTWMHEVGAGWLMTGLSSNPMHVALVQ